MQHTLNHIDQLRKELLSLSPMKQEYQQKLDKKFRLEFSYNSNHLEGNTLTYGETELLLIFGETKGSHDKREYDEMEAHDVAYERIREWAKDKEMPLTEMAIKNLNEIILVKPFWKDAVTADGQPTKRLIKIGDYKEFPNSVRLPNGQMFDYAPPSETPIQMGELIDWYRAEEEKKELHPVALAAMLHYRFVRIHPFDDGNGRISRLLVNYVLLKNGLPPIIIKSADKKYYLHALHQADTGDIHAFIDYVAEQAKWSLDISIMAAKGETIEEDDDINKEIALWKKEIVSRKIATVHRDDKIVVELFRKTIKSLFEKFEEGHKSFYDVFHQKSCYAFINNSNWPDTQWLSKQIDEIEKGIQQYNSEENEHLIIPDTFNTISIQVHLQEYKFDEKNPFSISSIITFNLQPYNYLIKYNNKEITSIKYGDILSEEVVSKIINDIIKSVFDLIKGSTKEN